MPVLRFNHRFTFFVFILIFFILPQKTFAQFCSDTGTTILFVNGVSNTAEKASKGKDNLETAVEKFSSSQSLDFKLIYNETHSTLEDFRDVSMLKNFAEGLFKTGSTNIGSVDPDYENMLMQLNTVETQKILLVAHSQGNFYANAIREELISKYGISPNSIGVYSVGTPAKYVSGGGQWITSENDKVIYGAFHQLLGHTILKPNSTAYTADNPNGHGFVGTYLALEGNRIGYEIKKEIEKLSSDPNRDQNKACFSFVQGEKKTFTQDAANMLKTSVGYAVAAVSGISRPVVVLPYRALAYGLETTWNTANYITQNVGGSVSQILTYASNSLGTAIYSLRSRNSFEEPIFFAVLPTVRTAISDTQSIPTPTPTIERDQAIPQIQTFTETQIENIQPIEQPTTQILSQVQPASQPLEVALSFSGGGGAGPSTPQATTPIAPTVPDLSSFFSINVELSSTTPNTKIFRIFGTKAESDSVTFASSTETSTSTAFSFFETFSHGVYAKDWFTGSHATGTLVFDVKTIDGEFVFVDATSTDQMVTISYPLISDLLEYAISIDGTFYATTSQSTTIIPNIAYGDRIFSVTAKDLFGNEKTLEATTTLLAPLLFGYQCVPDQNDSYQEGGVYVKYAAPFQQSDQCTYTIQNQIPGLTYYGLLFRGVEGASSMQHYRDMQGATTQTNSVTSFSNLQDGDQFFAVGIGLPPEVDFNDMVSFLSTGSSTLTTLPEHKIIHFTYNRGY